VPFWVDTFKISNAAFGSMYATVTLVSAFLLSLTGKYIDFMPLKKFGMIVFIGLVISVVLLSQSYNLPVLIVSLLLVRFFGQGLMTHTSSTDIARHFDDNRGKALGLIALGHPAGQLILPLFVASMIIITGWRSSLIIMAVTAFVLLIPALWAITPITGFEPDIVVKSPTNTNKTANYFKSFTFWILSLNIFVLPFICTAVILYQYSIGQAKGWDISWVAFSFAFYAIFNAIALLFSGSLADRFSGITLLPLYLIPTLLALILLSLTSQKWVFPLFYSLLGVSSGLGSTINTSVQVEIYGKDNLGKIRSYFSTMMVISTALGPPAFGYFIDMNYSFDFIMLFFSVITAFITILSFKLWNKKDLKCLTEGHS